jgi:signal recognition particle receptor subunit beta
MRHETHGAACEHGAACTGPSTITKQKKDAETPDPVAFDIKMPSALLEAAEGLLPEFAYEIAESVEDTVGVIGTLALFVGLVIFTLAAVKFIQNALKSGAKTIGLVKGDTILLLGNTNSGKTVLFYQLAHGKTVQTVTSMKELDAETTLHSMDEEGSDKIFKILDFPGHPRLRGGLSKYFSRGSSILFMVDATTIGKESETTVVAEFLYELLTDPTVTSAQLPVLIACNKSDLADAKSTDKVKALLEGELETLRSTSSSLGDIGGDDEGGAIKLGVEGKVFTFDDAAVSVTFTMCSAAKGKFKEVESFVRSQ